MTPAEIQKEQIQNDTIQAIASVIRIATPRNTVRGRKDRNRLVKRITEAVKALAYKTEKP